MTLWNIGAEGQLYLGATAATWFALHFPEAPALISLPSMVVLSMVAGGLWCLLAGVLKAYWDVNEIIITLMLNYIAILGVEYLIYVPWKDPQTFGFPFTPFYGEGAHLPVLFGGRVHFGLIFALAAAAILSFVYGRTTFGFEVRAIGSNPRAAHYAGMNIKRTIILVMFFSGALAGLAGMSEIAGLHHRLQPDFSPGYGYTAIIVAWLAKLNPLAILGVSILFGGLLTGGDLIQITMKLPLSIVNILQATILFFILGGEFFRYYRIRRIRE
jgi:simple sugar transport system permease protein